MKGISVGELVKQAKGEDRSLRQYARDSGVDAAVLSRIINGTYLPRKPGIYEALTSPRAAPRGGVSCRQLIEAAGSSVEYLNGMTAGMAAGTIAALADVPSSALIRVLQARGIAAGDPGITEASPSSAMKPEEIIRIQRLQSEVQRFTATANGIILGSLGKKGTVFQLLDTNGTDIDGIHFDTCVRLMNHEVSEFLIRYAFLSEEAHSLSLAKNTVRAMVEELVFLRPSQSRAVAVVTNHPGAYDDLCSCKDRLSYNGELSALLFDFEKAAILKQEYLSHYIAEVPLEELLLI